MNNDIKGVIVNVKKYLLKNYNYLIIDINDNFIGCKFYDTNYYLFFISYYENHLTLSYRDNFTKQEIKRKNIDSFSNLELNIWIESILKLANKVNSSLSIPKKKLKNALVNYLGKNNHTIKQYKEDKNSENYYTLEDMLLDKMDGNNTEIINEKEVDVNDFLNIRFEDLNVSNRLLHALNNNEIYTMKDLEKYDYSEIVNFRNLGDKSINELEELINNYNRKMGLPEINLQQNVKNPKNLRSAVEVFEENLDFKVMDYQYSNILIDDLQFSIRTKNCIGRIGIKYLNELIKMPLKNLCSEAHLGKKGYEEIEKFKLEIMEENTFKSDNSSYLFRILQNLEGKEKLSMVPLKIWLSNYTRYPVEKLSNDISILRSKNLINYTMDGINIKRLRIMDAIEELNEIDKEIMDKRLNGRTLDEIGKQLNVTRERIRQKIAKALIKLPKVYEDKYKKIFEEYNFSKQEFCKIYNETEITYNYLKEKYKQGEKRLDEGINDSNFNEQQKDIISKFYKIIKINGVQTVVNRQNILRELVKEHARSSIKIEKFNEIYNSFCRNHKDYNLEESDTRSMEGSISRLDNVVMDFGKQFRYYDYNSISKEDYELLESLFDLETGYYSTLLLFINNKELMESLDIKNEYELHNIAKNKLKSKNVTFDRMPIFFVNEIDKYSFFDEKIKEFAPISVNDFLEIMETEYGHKSGTLLSYISSTFVEYIFDGIIKTNMPVLQNEDIEKIKTFLTEPIYNMDDLKLLLIKNGYKNVEEIIINPNMYKIGYKIRNNYIIRKDVNTVEDYVKELIRMNDFISIIDFKKISGYWGVFKKFEKSYDIFLISKDEYITIKKLNELGITKENVELFIEDIINCFKDKDYFTINNIRDNINIVKLDDFGFDDIFFENIIVNIENLGFVRVDNNKIFSFANNPFDSKKFIIDNIGLRTSIFVDELQNELYEKYGINISYDKIKNVIMDTDLYFSDELNKIYQNKEYYYEEVYHYE